MRYRPARASLTLLGLLITGHVAAAEAEPIPAPALVPAPAPAAAPPPWTQKGRLGAFFNNTTTSNGDNSRDPSIGGAARSTAILGALDYDNEWTSGLDSVSNLVKGRYGRVSSNGGTFAENEDEARYDGVYRRELSDPHFVYLGWGVESVWTGPYHDDPALPPSNARDPFDPLLAKASGGYGERYADWYAADKFEWRLGVRVQKRWGSLLVDSDRRLQTGPELLVRYEASPATWGKDLKYFGQYEGFAEFNDISHVTNLVTAGMTFQLSRYINVELALRAYYESRPKDADDRTQSGFSQWSIKQDTLVGAVYNF